VPFRSAHEVIGKLVAHSIAEKVAFADIPLAKYQEFSPAFATDLFACLNLETALAARKGIGAPSPQNVAAQIERWKGELS
jgi:argininosuccinate lyase